MGLEPELLELLNVTATHYRYAGEDEHGNHTWGTGSSVDVAVRQNTKDNQGFDAHDQMPTHPSRSVMLVVDAMTPSPSVHDKWTVRGTDYYATSVQDIDDDTGLYYHRVNCVGDKR